MKNTYKVLFAFMIIMIMMFQISFASDGEFVITKTYSFTNESNYTNPKAFLTVFIGQKDLVRYQKDGDITITPMPDEREVDKYGNIYAKYDLGNYKPGRTLNIFITRKYKPGSYDEEIAMRSESTVTKENEIFIQAELGIDSKEDEMIAKAKEITYTLSSDYKRAKALFEYVNTQTSYDEGTAYFNKRDSMSTLRSKKGGCIDFAMLYAALCRSIKIPCKIVTGYKIERKEEKPAEMKQDLTTGEYYRIDPVYKYEVVGHAWNEIFLDDYGWVPVDTCVQYTKDGERTAYWNSFGKIDARDYIACGIFDPNGTEIVVTDNFKQKDSTITVQEVIDDQASKHHFEDLEGFGWAEESIDTLYDMGVIKGYTDKEFGPASNISRIEFICILARVLKNLNYSPKTDGMIYYYMDYDRTHYSKQEYDFLMRCLEEAYPFSKFEKGYGAISNIFGDRLEMNKAITRGEVVALMDAFLTLPSDGSATFTDILDNKFCSSIIKAYSNGIITGYGDGTFKPNNPIRRAEIAVIFDRYVGIKDFVM